ncbi:MAG TPA: hypothetical protein VE177_00230 [Candidatus Binatus sp.]|nr:hypothetical protein [Candidatus Binatus sp.]
MTTRTQTKSCYYCDEPGTETIVVSGIRYWFCPNHKAVLVSWLEEDQLKREAQSQQLRKELAAASAAAAASKR